jgi:hypothetical protein
MRLSLLLLLLLPLSALTSRAQHYTRDLGFRAGAFFGPTYRQYFNDEEYLEAMAQFNGRSFRVILLKQYSHPSFHKFSENLQFLYGFGLHAGVKSTDEYHVFSRTYYYGDYRTSPVFGLDGYMGMEYRFPDFPFLVGIDFKPFFEYSVNQYFDMNMFDFAFILKYLF